MLTVSDAYALFTSRIRWLVFSDRTGGKGVQPPVPHALIPRDAHRTSAKGQRRPMAHPASMMLQIWQMEYNLAIKTLHKQHKITPQPHLAKITHLVDQKLAAPQPLHAATYYDYLNLRRDLAYIQHTETAHWHSACRKAAHTLNLTDCTHLAANLNGRLQEDLFPF
jgi:hypothetical protein